MTIKDLPFVPAAPLAAVLALAGFAATALAESGELDNVPVNCGCCECYDLEETDLQAGETTVNGGSASSADCPKTSPDEEGQISLDLELPDVPDSDCDDCDETSLEIWLTDDEGRSAQIDASTSINASDWSSPLTVTIECTRDGDSERSVCRTFKFCFSDCDKECDTCEGGGEDPSGAANPYGGLLEGPGGPARLTIPVGTSNFGRSFASLELRLDTTDNPGRAALALQGWSGITHAEDAGGLTSVTTQSAHAKIETFGTSSGGVDTQAFTVTLSHDPSSPATTEFRTVKVEELADGTLQATVSAFSKDRVMTWSKSGNTWTFTDGGGMKKVERTELSSSTTQQSLQFKEFERDPDNSSTYLKVSDVIMDYEKIGGTWKIVEKRVDPDGEDLVSTWTYFAVGEMTGPGYFGVARLKDHDRHDGYYERHSYDVNGGVIKHIVEMPFGDAAVIRTTSWDPATGGPANGTRTRVDEYTGTIEIARTETVYETGKITVHRYSDATDKLTTVTEFHAPGTSGKGGRPEKITRPDGTVTLYGYTTNGIGNFEITAETGEPGSSGIDEGTERVTTINPDGITEGVKETAISQISGDDVVIKEWTSEVDPFGRPEKIHWFPTFPDGWTIELNYACCGLASEKDKYGILTQYKYDDLGRRIRTNRLDVTEAVKYRGLTVSRYRYAEEVEDGLFGSVLTNEISRTVHTGPARTETETWGPSPRTGALVKLSVRETEFLNPAHDTPSPNLAPDVGKAVTEERRELDGTGSDIWPTQTTEHFFDGTPFRSTGALRPDSENALAAAATGPVRARALLDGTAYREPTATRSDWLGRPLESGRLPMPTGSDTLADVATSTLAAKETRQYDSTSGQLEAVVDPDGVTTLHAYDGEGDRVIIAVDLDGDGITYGTDRITHTKTRAATRSGGPDVLRTVTKVWEPGDTDDDPTTGGTVVSTVDRTPHGLKSWTSEIGVANESVTETTIDAAASDWTTTTTHPDGSETDVFYDGGRWSWTLTKTPSTNPLYYYKWAADSSSQPGYDSLNRLTHVQDSRTGVTETAYVSAISDAVASVTPPGGASRKTSYAYDHQGRRTQIDAPNSPKPGTGTYDNITNTEYFTDGKVKEVSGDQAYPVSYTYDYAGRMKTMTTSGTETATTTWIYDDQSGRLERKEYDDGKGTDYTHTDAGRLETRKWARENASDVRIETTYTYDNGGRLGTVSYNDGTPGVTHEYDALGRKTAEIQTDLSRIDYAYDSADLRLDTETVAYDLNGNGTADITRVLDRSRDNLARDVGWTLEDGGTPDHAASYGYDGLGRLDRFHASASLPGSPDFAYTYEANSRSLVDQIDAPAHTVLNTWESDRDVLDRRENMTSLLPVEEASVYDYTVNHFGQRDSVDVSGDAFEQTINGQLVVDQRDRSWAYDNLGQLVSETDVGDSAHDRGFAYDSIGNRTASIEADTDTTAAGAVTYTPDALNQYETITDPASEISTPAYDDDGNATSLTLRETGLPGGTFEDRTLVWDAENRLFRIKDGGNTVAEYIYDSRGRRIRRTVAGGTDLVYFYDGWNPIAEYDVSSSPHSLHVTYLWGLDLSGTMQGAGGVGGLLSVTSSTGTYYPTYDGNGNVSEYLDTSGDIAAHYEYDAFGNVVNFTEQTTGQASAFRHRFSTKPQDGESGLLYYGYRHYDPVTGRWPSRDPIEEEGGLNLYGFVGNDGVNSLDLLGNIPVAATIAAFEAAAVLAELAINKCPPRHVCPEPCRRCCNTAHASGQAALKGAYAAGMASCATLVAPWVIGGCMAYFTATYPIKVYNLKKTRDGCIEKCNAKPPCNTLGCDDSSEDLTKEDYPV